MCWLDDYKARYYSYFDDLTLQTQSSVWLVLVISHTDRGGFIGTEIRFITVDWYPHGKQRVGSYTELLVCLGGGGGGGGGKCYLLGKKSQGSPFPST